MFRFAQTGFGSLWPVIFFLPWVLLSGAYLFAWVHHRRVLLRHSRVRGSRADAKGLSIMGVSLLLAAAPPGFTEPPLGEHQGCPVSTEDAHSLADRLFDQGSYQAAGECYLAAGDYDRANRAFVKAVGPASGAIARRASVQGNQAKAFLRKVRLAFRPEH